MKEMRRFTTEPALALVALVLLLVAVLETAQLATQEQRHCPGRRWTVEPTLPGSRQGAPAVGRAGG